MGRMFAPDPDSATAAVITLRAELEMVERALDSIDRKAALLPAVVATVAGIFIAPNTRFTDLQKLLLLPTLPSFLIAVLLAILVLRTSYLNVGPNSRRTAANVHRRAHVLNAAIASELAIAVTDLSRLAIQKGRRLNSAMEFAAATIVLTVSVRIAGGFA